MIDDRCIDFKKKKKKKTTVKHHLTIIPKASPLRPFT